MTEPTVTITVKEYESLQKDCLWLNALECAGVDKPSGRVGERMR